MAKIKALIITTWYPNVAEPTKCTFTKEIVDAQADYSSVEPVVVSPIPKFASLYFNDSKYRQIPTLFRKNYPVYYPRYFKIPDRINRGIGIRNYYKTIREIIGKNGLTFDVVHTHGLDPDAFVGAKIARQFHKPLVVHVHDSLISDNVQTLRLFEYARAILAVSQTQKKRILELFPTLEGKIHCIYNGIRSEFFQPLPAVRANGQKAKFVFLGRLHPIKGIDWLIRDIEIVMKDIDYELHIYGDGILEQTLATFVQSARLENKIFFHGRIGNNEVPEILSQYHFFLFPSLSETFGIVTIEALAVGIPVIASRIDATQELLGTDEDAAILFQPGNAKDLNSAIKKALEYEWQPEKLKQVAYRFHIKNTAQEIEKVYREVLARDCDGGFAIEKGNSI